MPLWSALCSDTKQLLALVSVPIKCLYRVGSHLVFQDSQEDRTRIASLPTLVSEKTSDWPDSSLRKADRRGAQWPYRDTTSSLAGQETQHSGHSSLGGSTIPSALELSGDAL